MIDALIFISARPIVITLALLGAGLVMAGSLGAGPKKTGGKTRSGSHRQPPLARGLTKTGYALTGVSIFLFIIAGFVSDLSSSPE